ncbi:hypothetical protein CRUP_016824, partial [Coryphaenoides rupestris]
RRTGTGRAKPGSWWRNSGAVNQFGDLLLLLLLLLLHHSNSGAALALARGTVWSEKSWSPVSESQPPEMMADSPCLYISVYEDDKEYAEEEEEEEEESPSQKLRGDDQETEGGHACEYCEKVFNTNINKRRHERRVSSDRAANMTAQQQGEEALIGAVHYTLDVSSNGSGSLRPVPSTSAVGTGEAVEVCASSSASGDLESLVFVPAQSGQPPSSDAVTGKDESCPSPANRISAKLALLPQMKPELGAKAVVAPSSSSLVSSLIEELLPQKKRSTMTAPRERTIFLSPKLKRLLDNQDGLKPTLALITDGQKFSLPLSVSVVPAGSVRYKRRTVSPPEAPESSTTSGVQEKIPDVGNADSVTTASADGQHASPPHTLDGKDDAAPPVEEKESKLTVPEESWPPRSGGNPCNQRPLDLSNAVKRGKEDTVAEAALDLSLQKQSLDDLPSGSNSVPLFKKRKPTTCMLEKAMLNQYTKATDAEEQNPFDPALNLPGHVFLTDPIALNTPVVDPATGAVVPFSPTVTLNDSLLNSYSITSNTMSTDQMIEQQQAVSLPSTQTVDPGAPVTPLTEPVTVSDTSLVTPESPAVGGSNPEPEPALMKDEEPTLKEEDYVDQSTSPIETPQAKIPPPTEPAEAEESSTDPQGEISPLPPQQTFTKNFVCNVCYTLFHSMKELGHHVADHAEEWPYKCEFCVVLFDAPAALLEHRLALHAVGTTYVCSVCSKEFVYLSNLKHHQEELHPGRQCSYTEEEKGKLRPQNYNCSARVSAGSPPASASEDCKKSVKKEEDGASSEEQPTTVKTTAATEDSKVKEPDLPDVRLGINQHYPSFKPPPFPYHNRSPAGSMASATNFTTHNIPQSFSTAIRCTKCGKSFDNMPELHKHILACANASDKRRYTPKMNPIPLRHFAKAQNGVLSTTNASNGLNAAHRTSQANNRSKQNQESPVKIKLTALNKRKKRLAQRAASQRNKPAPASHKPAPVRLDAEQEMFVCPHCSREFTMRRSRTKHMAVCPKKPKEGKKRKDAGVSLTKENNGHLLRGSAAAAGPLEEKRQASAAARGYASTPAKRPAILPVQAVLSNKRSKIIIKESMQQQNQESSSLGDLPVTRTFNPSMRQYGRSQAGVKDAAKTSLKITVAKEVVLELQS